MLHHAQAASLVEGADGIGFGHELLDIFQGRGGPSGRGRDGCRGWQRARGRGGPGGRPQDDGVHGGERPRTRLPEFRFCRHWSRHDLGAGGDGDRLDRGRLGLGGGRLRAHGRRCDGRKRWLGFRLAFPGRKENVRPRHSYEIVRAISGDGDEFEPGCAVFQAQYHLRVILMRKLSKNKWGFPMF